MVLNNDQNTVKAFKGNNCKMMWVNFLFFSMPKTPQTLASMTEPCQE